MVRSIQSIPPRLSTYFYFWAIKTMPLPDRFTIAGSPEQIAAQLPILQALYLGFKELESSSTGSNRLPAIPEFEDWLQVTLHWIGKIQLTSKDHYIEKSFRLVGIDPKTRDLTYFQTLGRAILAKFNNMPFQTGHVKVKYTHWKTGFQTWGYFSDQGTGYRIIEAMTDIAQKPLHKELVKAEFSAYPTELYDPLPDKVQLAGKLVRPKARAPIANMKFHKATVLFPWIGHTEKLCQINGYVMPNLDFLNAYT